MGTLSDRMFLLKQKSPPYFVEDFSSFSFSYARIKLCKSERFTVIIIWLLLISAKSSFNDSRYFIFFTPTFHFRLPNSLFHFLFNFFRRVTQFFEQCTFLFLIFFSHYGCNCLFFRFIPFVKPIWNNFLSSS